MVTKITTFQTSVFWICISKKKYNQNSTFKIKKFQCKRNVTNKVLKSTKNIANSTLIQEHLEKKYNTSACRYYLKVQISILSSSYITWQPIESTWVVLPVKNSYLKKTTGGFVGSLKRRHPRHYDASNGLHPFKYCLKRLQRPISTYLSIKRLLRLVNRLALKV